MKRVIYGFPNNKKLFSSKLIYFLVASLINIFLITHTIPNCSDTNSYLNHPGYNFNIMSADSFLYFLLYIIKDNILWFKSIQIFSVVLFEISLLILPINNQKLILGSTIPWFFSILGIHFWSCGIRNSISFSCLFLVFALLNTTYLKNQRFFKNILTLIFIILSILTHWSTTLILPVVLFPEFFKQFLNALKKLISSQRINKKFLFVFCISLIFYCLYIFSGYGKVILYGIFARREAYGTIFPYIMIANLTLFYLFRKSFLSDSKYITSFSFFILILSSGALLGVNPLVIRFQLQLWILFLVSLLIFSRNIKNLYIYYLLSSPAFLYYFVQNYPSYFLN